MVDDEKLTFYLKHRAQIEQWATLQQHAAASLDRALQAAVEGMAGDPQPPAPDLSWGNPRIVKLRIPDIREPVWIELQWTAKQLFKGSDTNTWPTLIVVVTPKKEFLQLREAVKKATKVHSRAFGLTHEGRGAGNWWVWYGPLQPTTEPIVIDEYAAACADRFAKAWIDMHEPIRSAVTRVRERSPRP